MNRTLFDCGIKKSVETRKGEKFDITSVLPKSVKLPNKPIECEICKESFAAKKYLDSHVRWKHGSDLLNIKSKPVITSSYTESGKVSNNECTLVLDDPSVVDTREHEVAKPENRRGSSQRRSYTVEFKAKTLERLDFFSELKVKKKWEKVAQEQGVSKSLVVKWNNIRDKIKAESERNKQKKNAGGVKSTRQRRKLVGDKAKNSEKYPLASARVIVEFKLRRAKGCKVSKLWLKKKMKSKIEECYGKEEACKFKGSGNWFQRFKKRHGISFRRRTNKKKDAADEGRERIQKFHRDLREAVKSRRRRVNSTQDVKYERWTPQNRYNIDQVPLPFVVEQDKTYDVTGNKQVWVSQPSSGLDKRQATLQLCIRAEGDQHVKPAIVFRGKGNVFSAEKAQYDQDVDVYFQSSAWMDTQLNQEWVRRTLIPGIGTSPQEKVIFADNVGFQQEKGFHEMCRKNINAIIYLLPENHTDKVQPIDAGFGKQMKAKFGEAMDKWLEEDDNLDMWHDRLSAKKRRILMTQWAGEAWRKLSLDKMFAKKLFMKTGCLMTADGSDDNMIRPQGLEPYSF
ncbi:hypothetical protein QZH41_007971 [Actinostola sp. cb2023]|nr:hypothetical protein QZH41_007971 [Actinostola sp. cb2023]